MVVIVAKVTSPNTAVTQATASMFPRAAGYMRSGISGSQGPKMKIVKRIQGVKEADVDAGSCGSVGPNAMGSDG